MSIPIWPSINYNASFDNFSLTLGKGDNISSTDMDDGESRSRRRFNTTLSPLVMSIELTTAEIGIFKSFLKNDIRDGSFWFYMPIFDGTAYAQNLVKIDKTAFPVITPLGWDNYNLTLTLIVRSLS